MKVSELMDLLDAMPSEYEVAVVDGEERKELDYMMNIEKKQMDIFDYVGGMA